MALGFTKNSEGEFKIHGKSSLVASVEKYFEINLIDEVAFFAPTGKAGELFEIPVLHSDCEMDRLYLVALGDLTLKDVRTAGAALGRKVRG